MRARRTCTLSLGWRHMYADREDEVAVQGKGRIEEKLWVHDMFDRQNVDESHEDRRDTVYRRRDPRKNASRYYTSRTFRYGDNARRWRQDSRERSTYERPRKSSNPTLQRYEEDDKYSVKRRRIEEEDEGNSYDKYRAPDTRRRRRRYDDDDEDEDDDVAEDTRPKDVVPNISTADVGPTENSRREVQ